MSTLRFRWKVGIDLGGISTLGRPNTPIRCNSTFQVAFGVSGLESRPAPKAIIKARVFIFALFPSGILQVYGRLSANCLSEVCAQIPQRWQIITWLKEALVR